MLLLNTFFYKLNNLQVGELLNFMHLKNEESTVPGGSCLSMVVFFNVQFLIFL